MIGKAMSKEYTRSRTIATRGVDRSITGMALAGVDRPFNCPPTPLTELARAGRSFSIYSWTFMLGAPSLKFYALLATFALGFIAFQAETKVTKQRVRPTVELAEEVASVLTGSATLVG